MKPKWVQKFYDIFGSKLQGWYDKIDKFDLPPEIKAALQTLTDALPEDWSSELLKWVVWFYGKFGPEKTSSELKKRLTVVSNFKF